MTDAGSSRNVEVVYKTEVGLAVAVGAGVLGIAWNALPALYLVIARYRAGDRRRQPEPP
jgi:hypothetical protein